MSAFADRALETSTTTGTGDLTVAGAVTGYKTLNAAFGTGVVFDYAIVAVDGSGVPTGEWETGRSSLSASTTLTRTSGGVLESSNANALVSFAAGTKRVFVSLSGFEATYQSRAAIDMHSAGVISGGVITVNADPTKFDISAGVGYINDGTGAAGSIKRVTWSAFTAQNNIGAGYNHVAITSAGAVSVTASIPNVTDRVYLEYFFYNSNAGAITTIWPSTYRIDNFAQKVNEYARDVFGSMISSGCVVTEPTNLTLSMSSGYMHSGTRKIALSTTTAFFKIYGCTDFFVDLDTSSPNTVNVTQWNDKTQLSAAALVTMTNSYWKKDCIVINPSGGMYYTYGAAEYATEDEARASPLGLFNEIFGDRNAFIATIIIQKGASTIGAYISDIRPYMPRILYTEAVGDYDDLINKPDHNDLSAKQGGTAAEYYHLTSADYTGTGTGTLIRDTGVITRPITGFTSGAGTVAATDTILQAIEKLDGNVSARQVGIQFEEEGSNIGTAGAVTNVDFVGAGVTASHSAGTVTVTVAGGGGSGTSIGLALALGSGFN